MLDGKNFLHWSKSVKITLGAKNKVGILEGEHPKPKEAGEEMQKWIICDYMVRSGFLQQ